ncbi:ecto-ADP-ribosyltransferase 4-like [Odontesthes bonariensis]|uniref:ecto-ADP-ribosyltransferase 4-like n=1 Tax=Odontesthes bonariensis TaxID=219752 RepID=UPI003F5855EF
MKANMVVFALLCLLFCWMHTIGSKKIIRIFPSRDDSFPLNMAKDSVDDMYSGCGKKMEKIVKEKYFKNELSNEVFRSAWEKAKNCANRNKKTNEDDKALTDYHKHAICVYTSGYRGFYEKFNEAVRTNRTIYDTLFPYHSLHFWLTGAVQILKKRCFTTYRRTKAEFIGKVKQIIRFGSFTSTSKLSNLTQFGEKTCFKIQTCSGAYLKEYPLLRDREQEVLIPPYEQFKITKKCKSRKILDCEMVYVLKSAGNKSNLNCHVAK